MSQMLFAFLTLQTFLFRSKLFESTTMIFPDSEI